MPLRSHFLSFAVALLVVLIAVRGGDEKPKDDSIFTMEKFAVAKNGDVLLIPVTVGEKTYSFVLDTGATISVFDSKIPVGPYRDSIRAQTPNGHKDVKLYETPTASVGKLALKGRGYIAQVDLSRIREVGDAEIYGILGMDFLKNHIVQFDVGEGEIRFLTAVPLSSGKVFPITIDSCDMPHLEIDVAGVKNMPIAIDTGCSGLMTGNFAEVLFDDFVIKKDNRVLGTTLSESLSGTHRGRVGQTSALTIGEFAIPKPMFCTSGSNSLGLAFVSRFVATFDFSNGKLHLKKGSFYDRPDVRNLSGLHVVRKSGKAVVEVVDVDSVATRAGIKAGDVVVSIDDRKAEGINLTDFLRVFCNPGTVSLVLKRKTETLTKELVLKP